MPPITPVQRIPATPPPGSLHGGGGGMGMGMPGGRKTLPPGGGSVALLQEQGQQQEHLAVPPPRLRTTCWRPMPSTETTPTHMARSPATMVSAA